MVLMLIMTWWVLMMQSTRFSWNIQASISHTNCMLTDCKLMQLELKVSSTVVEVEELTSHAMNEVVVSRVVFGK